MINEWRVGRDVEDNDNDLFRSTVIALAWKN
jgi:hypothetical protein